jgi:hypothetical protein
MRKWLRRTLLLVATVAIIAIAVIWIGSERVLRRSYADVTVAAPTLAGDPESGKHWAAILGCTDCQDSTLHGMIIASNSLLLGTLVAPNLTVKRKEYDDAALARLIRFGIKHDGTGVQLMPSQIFYHVDDQTIADVIAFIRAAPDWQRDLPTVWNGPVSRCNLFTWEWKMTPDEVDRKAARLGDTPHAEGLDRGRYIASVACGECHGLDQKGGGPVPNLAVAKVYNAQDFATLMHTGVGKGGRQLNGMMAGAASRRFSSFTEDELSALKAFLDAREP